MRRGDIRPSTKFVHYWAGIASCFQIAIWTAIVRAAIPEQWLTILAQESCRWPITAITALGFLPFYMIWGISLFLFQLGAVLVDIAVLVLPPTIVFVALYVLIDKFLPNLFGIIADAFSCRINSMIVTFAAMTIIMATSLQTCFLGAFHVTIKLFTSDFFIAFERPVDYIIENWDRYPPYGLSFLILVVVAIVSNVLYRPFLIGSLARKLGTTNYGLSSNLAWACILMFVANISLAVLYYGHVYNPKGTWKPAWTENLGRKFANFV
jgi:hypothetical protein